MGKLIGYARVSSRTQSLDVQIAALTSAGVEAKYIYQEKVTGTRTEGRNELARMLDFVRVGDVLVITKLDRLARSLTDLLKITAQLAAKEVQLRCLDQKIDTTTPEGRMTYQILGAVAEFETAIRKARQRDGIDAAVAKGDASPFKGRPASIDAAKVARMKEDGQTPSAIAKALGIARSSVYRMLDQSAGA
ncbi:MAG: recombinase family protein [Cypionkella sp.]|uniref:recombinase family protein n=1 Tax=Cypionkella sp. TaxID=2811411 RepID=UPI002607DDF2|nr:recombinase family protein [Cypionkella sp.]MDB5659720.1 recombinase family protein [Cypionkella sp.]